MIGCIIVLSLIAPLPTSYAYRPPLQDVTAWAEGNTVHFKVYDPALEKWQEGACPYNGSLEVAPTVVGGIVIWQSQSKVAYFSVYDPLRESWMTDSTGATMKGVSGGIVFCRRDYEEVVATYDPAPGLWKKMSATNVKYTGRPPRADVAIGIYDYFFDTGWYDVFYVYDPNLHVWKDFWISYTSGDCEPFNIDAYGSISYLKYVWDDDDDSYQEVVYTYGYDQHNHKWYEGPALPLASFVAPEWSNGPVYVTDMSFGGGSWHFDFGDGVSNNLRSQLHTYAAEGAYTIVMTVSSPNGAHFTEHTVTVERTPPAGAISIENGAKYTGGRTVVLSLPANDAQSGLGFMRLGDDGQTWSNWIQYAETFAYELPAGDGRKTVYVQFKDRAGNTSEVYSDTIILDQGAVSLTAGINQVVLNWSDFADQLSGIAKYRLYYSNNGALLYEGNSKSFTHRNLDLKETHSYLIHAVDSEGNISRGITAAAKSIINGRWADSFSTRGLNGRVSAFAVDGNGNLYAGGDFTKADSASVNYIAKWNGTAWSALGSGMNGPVAALAIDSMGNLYAGGEFTKASGVSVQNIAVWNGNDWSALGAGTNHPVSALATDVSGNLYAGAAGSILKWDGSGWSYIEGREHTGYDPSCVHALAADASGNLYAAGTVIEGGGVLGRYIAKWSGSDWSNLTEDASDMDHDVNTLAVDANGNLYAGGQFTRAGGVAAQGIAKWNGTMWSALGSGVEGRVCTLVAGSSGHLYAGGQFTRAGGVEVNNIAKWDGSAWSALGYGMSATPNETVYTLCVDNSGSLYAGGQFTSAGGKLSGNIAKWQGQPGLAAHFASAGICLWSSSSKGKISSLLPNLLGEWNGRLAASFPSRGLYLHNGSTWKKISSRKSAKSVVGIGDTLYVDFGTGIYRYRNGWSMIQSASPAIMAKYGEKLVASFTDSGLWEYNGSAWKRISKWTTAEQMVGIEQRLFVDFGAKGVYRIDTGGAWTKTTSNNPLRMQAFGSSLVASFDSGSASGIYLYRMNSWRKISSNPAAEGFASNPFTLFVDRGTEGIWKYEKKAWRQVGAQNPDTMAIYAGELAADFPGAGLRLYSNPGWSTLSTRKDAGLLQGVLFE